MKEENKKYLADILNSINLIEDFIGDATEYNLYEKDLKTQSAVERQLAIIGEILKQIKKS